MALKWLRKRVLLIPFALEVACLEWTLASKWLQKRALLVLICFENGLHEENTWPRNGFGRGQRWSSWVLDVASIAKTLSSQWLHKNALLISFALEVAFVDRTLVFKVAS